MSAFEVSCTPPRVAARRNNEAREPTLVQLGPFTPKAIVVFEGVPVGKTARRQLILRNTHKSAVEVQLTRVPQPECGISYEWDPIELSVGEQKSWEIVWNPTTALIGKELIIFTDSLGHRKDVQLILKSIELKPTSRKSVAKSFTVPTKLKLKSPSPPKVNIKRNVLPKKTTKALPVRQVSSWATPATSVTESSRNRSQSNRMGSYASRITEPVLGSSNKASGDGDGADDTNDQLTPSRNGPPSLCVPKENVDPAGTSLAWSPLAGKHDELAYMASQATPEVYFTAVQRNAYPTITIRKHLDVSPECDYENRTVPGTKVLVGPNCFSKKPPTVLGVRQDNVMQEQTAMVTPAGRTKFDPGCFSTVSKPTVTGKTFLKPEAECLDAIEQPGSDEGCDGTDSDENAPQRHLIFSYESLQNELEEVQWKKAGHVDDGVAQKILPSVEAPMMIDPLSTVAVVDQPVQLDEDALLMINNRTQVLGHDSSSQLSVITEENVLPLGITFPRQGSLPDALVPSHQQTFKINSLEDVRSVSVENVIKNVTVVLHTNDSLLSLPCLSVKSNQSLEHDTGEEERLFKEHEIRAQSSRFNINEVGRFSDEMMSLDRGVLGSKRSKETIDHYTSQLVSPPKRQCRFEMPANPSSSAIRRKERTVGVSGCKPIGFRAEQGRTTKQKQNSKTVQRNLTLKRAAVDPGTPLAAKASDSSKKRVFLYDSERHLKSLVNLDPFAATTTTDPFLKATMYHDELDFIKTERQVMKWLNALVTIPADLDTESAKPLDVGKLFDEVKGKELTLAPTKELISSKYYKNRLDGLRRAGIALYLSEEIADPLRKLRIQIDKQQISIRTDRNLHLDLVLQRTVLELLLCFNPLWLRLGLEVVYGEQIELQSNRDVVGLSTFIIQRLFRDRYLETKHSKAYNLSSAYAEHMRKLTLRTVLYLLLFLDTAKRRKLIKHNPCLFVRNAPYKETREVLVRFTSTLVAGIGDITKHLKRIGYTLSHRQSYLDEYHYAFENLAVDLRDGVRLTRVMEIILLREDLSAGLRVPPISRLQKIHNINLALRALEEAEYRIEGDITAKDICDGHREKTMSLLWQLVFKFRAPKFNAAATVLQRWWRTIMLKVVVNRRIEKKRAVVTMQRFARRYLAQKQAARRFGALVRIQQWWRSVREMRHARERYLTCRKAAIVLQTSYRRYVLSRKLQAASTVIATIRTEAKHRHHMAIILQRSIKSYILHRRLHSTVHKVIRLQRQQSLEIRSATKLQAFQRMRLARERFLRIRTATVTIQRRWRECLEARRARESYVQMRSGAISIQRYFRGYLQMRRDMQHYAAVRHLVVQMQRRRRAMIAMRMERTQYKRLQAATLSIQRHYRAQKQMQWEVQQYRQVRQAVLVFQRRYRAKKLMEQDRLRYECLRNATLCVQRRFRAQLSMRAARASYQELRIAALTIQMRYRATVEARVERNSFLELRRCTIVLQTRYRALVRGRQEALRYTTLRTSTLLIQRKWRATLQAKQERSHFLAQRTSVLAIQQFWRGVLLKRKLRDNYLHYRRAATVIQRHYRALMVGRSVRHSLEQQRAAAIVIQRHLRATLQMRRTRAAYQQLQCAAVTLQRRVRANRLAALARHQFNQMKHSVARISTWWHSILQMRRERQVYQQLRWAAVTLQQRFRARQRMREEVAIYQRIRTATIQIQRRYRAQRAMECCRGRFLNLRSASIVVQEYYRAYRQMKLDHTAYRYLREVTITVQRRYRGKLLSRQLMLELEEKKRAATQIQRWFRGYREMTSARARFQSIQRATLILQARYRARIAMVQAVQQLHRLREATIIIQTRWRATLAMRQQRARYQRILAAAQTIQTQYRAYKDRLIDQSAYRLYRSAVIIVQRRYREKLTTRMERHRFQQIQRTVNALQRYSRGLLARRAYRAKLTPEFVELRRRQKAALRLQAWWRGIRHRRRHQTEAMRKMAIQMVASRQEAIRDPSNRLSNVTRLCMRFLKSRFSSSDAIGILQRLERLSRLVPHMLVSDAVFLAQFCYSTMAQAIRSELDKILIEICARIILNLARFRGTKEQAFQENGLVTVSQMLLRWCDKDCAIFSTLCTLLWVLAHDKKKKNAIRRYMISKDAVFMLRETKKLVQRKEKMRRNVQRPPVGCLVPPSPQLMHTLPALEPDFGVDRSKPYVFYSSVFGFERVLQMLDVDLT
ncbi:microtubule binding protein [Anopheles darlingi]|uniref:Calponin-homology (CH) domain-containing protein n=1 Tax=Anopheles darlingi TaxID=43151 RepID=W5JHD5_ANODA|nr:microtubule binding protein [Anopheles darlingi]